MKVKTKVKVDMAPVQQVTKRLGITPDGDVQMFVTNMVSHRITRYMPFRSSALATKTKLMGGPETGHKHMAETKVKITKPTEVTVLGPYAHFQYMGKVWIYKPTGSTYAPKYGKKEETKKDLTYDKTKNPEAGPFWDKRLIAAEGAAMAADVQKYVDKKRNQK